MDKLIEMCVYLMIGVTQLKQIGYNNSFEINYLYKKIEYLRNYIDDTVESELNLALGREELDD